MLRQYTLHNLLGEGGYSKVYKCTDSIGIRYACKVMPKAKNRRCRIQQEIMNMKTLHFSPKIVHLVDCGEDDDCYYIIQELCRGGSVNDYICKYNYGENLIASIIRGTARGLCHMHENGLIHRDIKGSNIFFGDLSEDADVKIGDLGLSLEVNEKIVVVDELVGTPFFMSPENLLQRYEFKSDIWSVGVMAYNLLCGKMPFTDRAHPVSPRITQVWKSILHDTPNMECGKWVNISNEAKDFISLCLQKEAHLRPSARECLTHPWLTSTDINDRFKGQPLECQPFQYEHLSLMRAQTLKHPTFPSIYELPTKT